MKIIYNAEKDRLCIQFVDDPVDTQEVAPGVVVSYSLQGKLASLEIRDVRKNFGDLNIAIENITQNG